MIIYRKFEAGLKDDFFVITSLICQIGQICETMKIFIRRIIHNNESRLSLKFDYDRDIIAKVKTLDDCRWSRTLNVWHMPDNEVCINALISVLGIEMLVFDEGILPDSPAKGNMDCSKPGSISIEVINRKIRIKMPKDDKDIAFIRTLRYSRWLSKDFCWEVPDYPGNLDLITDHFGNRIVSLIQHDYIELAPEVTKKGIIGRNEVLLLKTPSGRVKIFAGYNKALINAIKKIPYSRWDSKNKWWTIPYSVQFTEQLTEVCKSQGLIISFEEELSDIMAVKRISRYDIPNYREAPVSYREKLTELRYSAHTVSLYISAFEEFINYYPRLETDTISEPQIKDFIRYLITERRVSESYQNAAINAIKFYYEKVLKGRRRFYFLDRPKREKTLPEVLNTQEILKMIQVTENIKHKLIIMFGYSSGLRLNEINRIKLSDIDRDRMQLRVEQGKGKKDRYTKLSYRILPELDRYIEEYSPKDLLFTGPGGGIYSDRSIQEVVKAAAQKAGVLKKVTPKILRHTFATHSLENGVDLRYIQSMLGHASSKTTEIYTHITTKGFDEIKSPMDNLDV